MSASIPGQLNTGSTHCITILKAQFIFKPFCMSQMHLKEKMRRFTFHCLRRINVTFETGLKKYVYVVMTSSRE